MAVRGLAAPFTGAGQPALGLAHCWSFPLPFAPIVAWSFSPAMGGLQAKSDQVITTGLLLWSFELERGTERGLRAPAARPADCPPRAELPSNVG